MCYQIIDFTAFLFNFQDEDSELKYALMISRQEDYSSW